MKKQVLFIAVTAIFLMGGGNPISAHSVHVPMKWRNP